jgi:hypothetical protein
MSRSKGPDLHVSVCGPDRVLVYAQTYHASQVVKACGDQRVMSVDELVVLIEALAPPRRAVDVTVHFLEQVAAAERETVALMERLRTNR